MRTLGDDWQGQWPKNIDVLLLCVALKSAMHSSFFFFFGTQSGGSQNWSKGCLGGDLPNHHLPINRPPKAPLIYFRFRNLIRYRIPPWSPSSLPGLAIRHSHTGSRLESYNTPILFWLGYRESPGPDSDPEPDSGPDPPQVWMQV